MPFRQYAPIGHTHAGLGGAPAWGSITGTLSAQTDLQTALNGKSATGHTHLLATGATDVTATVAEVNLLDLSGLTSGWVLSADTASTASWKAPVAGSIPTHTGEVTGDTALTVDLTAVTNKTDVVADSADDVLISDDSDIGSLKKVNLSSITDGGYF